MSTILVTSVVWISVSVGVCLALHRARQARPTPEPRDWYCTDGLWRTEAEAVAWVDQTDGSLAEWLAAWPTVEEPLYVPENWVA